MIGNISAFGTTEEACKSQSKTDLSSALISQRPFGVMMGEENEPLSAEAPNSGQPPLSRLTIDKERPVERTKNDRQVKMSDYLHWAY